MDVVLGKQAVRGCGHDAMGPDAGGRTIRGGGVVPGGAGNPRFSALCDRFDLVKASLAFSSRQRSFAKDFHAWDPELDPPARS